MYKVNVNTTMPFVIDYKKIKTPAARKNILNDPSEFKTEILNEIAGEFVLFENEGFLPLNLMIYEMARRFCPEIVLSDRNENYLVFKNHNWPVIRPLPIQAEVYQTPEFEVTNKKLVLEVFLEVEKIWLTVQKEKDFVETIKKFYKILIKEIKAAKITTLIGEGDFLPFFLACNLLTGKTAEIWWQKEINTKAIKIT